jgi:hypothetical protein
MCLTGHGTFPYDALKYTQFQGSMKKSRIPVVPTCGRLLGATCCSIWLFDVAAANAFASPPGVRSG